MMIERYSACECFEQTYRGKRTGTIVIVNRAKVNGTCFAGIAVPLVNGVAEPNALPVPTWVSPVKLARYHRVTEAEARQIAPMFFRAVDAYQDDADFAAAHDRIRFASILQPILKSYATSATSPV